MTPRDLNRLYVLALCVWREARGESELGMRLVAQTIRNRVDDKRWPNTYVGVITQPWQFSAFNANDPNVTKYPDDADAAWPKCVAAAQAVLDSSGNPFTTANHYCVNTLKPAWFDQNRVVAQEGNHVFLSL